MMKRFLTILAILSFNLTLSFVLLPASTSAAYDPTAQGCSAAGQANSPVCTSSAADPISGSNGIINTVATIAAWAGGVIAVIIIIISGFRFINSGGDSGKVASARNGIIYSAIGLLVIIIARVIVSFVLNNIK